MPTRNRLYGPRPPIKSLLASSSVAYESLTHNIRDYPSMVAKAAVISVLDRDRWTSNTDVIVVADGETKRLTWIPRDLWAPSISHRINAAFSGKGGDGLMQVLAGYGFPTQGSLCLRRSAVEKALEGCSIIVPVEEHLDFWYPLQPTLRSQEGRKRVSFSPPSETLSGERIHQWLGARYRIGIPGSDFERIKRQQILLRSLLASGFDWRRVVEDESLADIYGENPVPLLSRIDSTWTMATFNAVQNTVIDRKAVLISNHWNPSSDSDPSRDGQPWPRPEMAVVILSVGAPLELTGAIRSILAQAAPVELLVVNSGGGNVEARLPVDSPGIRFVSFDEVLWPGAARNRGIEMTSAPYVAFLASDCEAEPGWIERRMAWHRAGAAAVASSVVTDNPDGMIARASHLSLFSGRLPGLPGKRAVRFGVSYSRTIFQEYGLFREDLRIGEDSEFHNRMGQNNRPVWAPEVRTRHRTPVSLTRSLRDQYARGKLHVLHWPQVDHGSIVSRIRKRFGHISGNVQSGLKGSARKKARRALPLVLLNVLAYELGRWMGRVPASPHAALDKPSSEFPNTARWRTLPGRIWMGRTRRALLARQARHLAELHRFDEALGLFRRIQKEWPGETSGFEGAALAMATAHRWHSALELWQTSDDLLPGRQQPLLGMALALANLGRLDEAAALYDQVIQKWPNYAGALLGRARIPAQLEDFDTALSLCGHLWRRFGNTQALRLKVNLHLELEQSVEVESLVNELTTRGAPPRELIFCALPLLEYRHDWPAVAGLLLQHWKLTRGNPDLLNSLLTALARLGRHEQALFVMRHQRCSNDWSRWMIQIRVFLQTRRREYARAIFKKIWSKRQIERVSMNYFSAMITAAWEEGGPELAHHVLDLADERVRTCPRMPLHEILSCFQRARIAGLVGLRQTPPTAAPPREPMESVVAKRATLASVRREARLDYQTLRDICDTFSKLRRNCPSFYPDPSFVLSDALAVAGRIMRAVDAREPLSLIRLGDGEGVFLPCNRFSTMKSKDQAAIQRAWWGGTALDETDADTLGKELREAILDCDVLGIPDIERLARGTCSRQAERLSRGRNARGLLAVLDMVSGANDPEFAKQMRSKAITSCHIHQSFDYWGLWDLLLPRFRSVSLVTCRPTLADILSRRYDLAIRDVHLIPPERKGASSHDHNAHFPEIYRKTQEKLSGTGPGHVVLVAGGFLGKMYCHTIKAAGGIALDIGSAADFWCGLDTREVLTSSEHEGPKGLSTRISQLANWDPPDDVSTRLIR